MRSKLHNEFQGYGNWIAKHQRFWWPALSFLFIVLFWLSGMFFPAVFPMACEQSLGHVIGYGDKCSWDSNSNTTDCEQYSVIAFRDQVERIHNTTGDANLPLGKEILVVYLPWGDPPIGDVLYDLAAGEQPKGGNPVGIIVVTLPILTMLGLFISSLVLYFRYRRKLTNSQKIIWWSVYMRTAVNEQELKQKCTLSKLKQDETILKVYKASPLEFALVDQPGRMDTLGLAIGGLIWFGLSLVVGSSGSPWPLSFSSWILNIGISLIGLIMMIPFFREIWLGMSSRLIATNMRRILLLGKKCLYGNLESAHE